MSNNLNKRPSAIQWIGVCPVALNKAPNTDIIQFFDKPSFPMSDGEINADVQVDTSTVNSGPNGEQQSSKVMRSTSKPAKWFPNDPNRITPPDVRVGSQVLIFKFGDADEYRWMVWDLGPEKHRLDRVTYAFNASPETNENTPYSPECYYTLDFNPRDGNIRVSTSKANQEKASYILQIDGKNGKYALMDSENNLMFLDSMKKHWSIINADQSVIDMNGKKITLSAKDSVTLLGDKSVNIKTETFVLIAQKANIKADTLTIITKTTSLKADSTSIKSANTTIESNTTHIGNLGIQGSMTTSAGAGGGGGDIKTSGSITAQKDIVAGGISLMKHTHGVIDHSETTIPRK